MLLHVSTFNRLCRLELNNLNFHISFTFSLAKCFFRGLYLFILTPPPPLLPHHTQEFMISTNLNLHNQRMLLHKFVLFCPNGFWEEVFQRFSLHFKVKIHPPLWSLPSPGDHDLPKLEFTLLEDDSQQIWDFLAQTFLRRLSKTLSIYSNVFKCILYIKSMWNLTPPPLPLAHPTYRDFELKKLKPTLLGDGFFRQNIFEKEIFEKHQANSIIIIYPIFWKTWTFVFTNLNCLHLVMLCAEFGWNRQKKRWQCNKFTTKTTTTTTKTTTDNGKISIEVS